MSIKLVYDINYTAGMDIFNSLATYFFNENEPTGKYGTIYKWNGRSGKRIPITIFHKPR